MLRLPCAFLSQELSTCRTWDVNKHPKWLVFEVEGRLQIRPMQVVLAQRLLDGPQQDGKGPIAQLNMGEGKTRVIVPMMILELADKEKLVGPHTPSGSCIISAMHLHSAFK